MEQSVHFWNQLRQTKQPFFCVAPMADVTDAAFRRLIAKYSRHGKVGGGPDVIWTEFVSANGLMSKGREILARDLVYSEIERPIVAQLFSSDPETMQGAAKLCAELGFDGVDINMGCPDKTIEKQGAGAMMIQTPEKAVAVIAAAKRGIVLAGSSIPVSVKTRVGYGNVQMEWIEILLSQDIAALTVHARTRKELSLVPADWSRIKAVVTLRDRIAPQTVIIGNGDVISIDDGIQKAQMSGCNGVMVGRALFGNPWFFDQSRQITASLPQKPLLQKLPLIGKYFETRRTAADSAVQPITTKERLMVMAEHAKLFEELLGDIKNFAIMKKHFKAYCTGFHGAKELRIKLMETKHADEVEEIISTFLLQ